MSIWPQQMSYGRQRRSAVPLLVDVRGAADVFGRHARLDHLTAVGLQHAFALDHALGQGRCRVADVDLAAADFVRAAIERGLLGESGNGVLRGSVGR